MLNLRLAATDRIILDLKFDFASCLEIFYLRFKFSNSRLLGFNASLAFLELGFYELDFCALFVIICRL